MMDNINQQKKFTTAAEKLITQPYEAKDLAGVISGCVSLLSLQDSGGHAAAELQNLFQKRPDILALTNDANQNIYQLIEQTKVLTKHHQTLLGILITHLNTHAQEFLETKHQPLINTVVRWAQETDEKDVGNLIRIIFELFPKNIQNAILGGERNTSKLTDHEKTLVENLLCTLLKHYPTNECLQHKIVTYYYESDFYESLFLDSQSQELTRNPAAEKVLRSVYFLQQLRKQTAEAEKITEANTESDEQEEGEDQDGDELLDLSGYHNLGDSSNSNHDVFFMTWSGQKLGTIDNNSDTQQSTPLFNPELLAATTTPPALAKQIRQMATRFLVTAYQPHIESRSFARYCQQLIQMVGPTIIFPDLWRDAAQKQDFEMIKYLLELNPPVPIPPQDAAFCIMCSLKAQSADSIQTVLDTLIERCGIDVLFESLGFDEENEGKPEEEQEGEENEKQQTETQISENLFQLAARQGHVHELAFWLLQLQMHSDPFNRETLEKCDTTLDFLAAKDANNNTLLHVLASGYLENTFPLIKLLIDTEKVNIQDKNKQNQTFFQGLLQQMREKSRRSDYTLLSPKLNLASQLFQEYFSSDSAAAINYLECLRTALNATSLTENDKEKDDEEEIEGEESQDRHEQDDCLQTVQRLIYGSAPSSTSPAEAPPEAEPPLENLAQSPIPVTPIIAPPSAPPAIQITIDQKKYALLYQLLTSPNRPKHLQGKNILQTAQMMMQYPPDSVKNFMIHVLQSDALLTSEDFLQIIEHCLAQKDFDMLHFLMKTAQQNYQTTLLANPNLLTGLTRELSSNPDQANNLQQYVRWIFEAFENDFATENNFTFETVRPALEILLQQSPQNKTLIDIFLAQLQNIEPNPHQNGLLLLLLLQHPNPNQENNNRTMLAIDHAFSTKESSVQPATFRASVTALIAANNFDLLSHLMQQAKQHQSQLLTDVGLLDLLIEHFPQQPSQQKQFEPYIDWMLEAGNISSTDLCRALITHKQFELLHKFLVSQPSPSNETTQKKKPEEEEENSEAEEEDVIIEIKISAKIKTPENLTWDKNSLLHHLVVQLSTANDTQAEQLVPLITTIVDKHMPLRLSASEAFLIWKTAAMWYTTQNPTANNKNMMDLLWNTVGQTGFVLHQSKPSDWLTPYQDCVKKLSHDSNQSLKNFVAAEEFLRELKDDTDQNNDLEAIFKKLKDQGNQEKISFIRTSKVEFGFQARFAELVESMRHRWQELHPGFDEQLAFITDTKNIPDCAFVNKDWVFEDTRTYREKLFVDKFIKLLTLFITPGESHQKPRYKDLHQLWTKHQNFITKERQKARLELIWKNTQKAGNSRELATKKQPTRLFGFKTFAALILHAITLGIFILGMAVTAVGIGVFFGFLAVPGVGQLAGGIAMAAGAGIMALGLGGNIAGTGMFGFPSLFSGVGLRAIVFGGVWLTLSAIGIIAGLIFAGGGLALFFAPVPGLQIPAIVLMGFGGLLLGGTVLANFGGAAALILAVGWNVLKGFLGWMNETSKKHKNLKLSSNTDLINEQLNLAGRNIPKRPYATPAVKRAFDEEKTGGNFNDPAETHEKHDGMSPSPQSSPKFHQQSSPPPSPDALSSSQSSSFSVDDDFRPSSSSSNGTPKGVEPSSLFSQKTPPEETERLDNQGRELYQRGHLEQHNNPSIKHDTGSPGGLPPISALNIFAPPPPRKKKSTGSQTHNKPNALLKNTSMNSSREKPHHSGHKNT